MNNSNKIFAHLISIGNELLIGQVVDTNSSFIAKELNQVGVEVIKISAISDKEEEIIKEIELASKQAQVIITTGGLGPTKDDITKYTLAKLFGVELIKNEEVYKHIENLFAKYNLPLNSYTKSQADLPKSTLALHNRKGTAPGMWTQYKKSVVINLPGVPTEMKTLITEQVLPKIQQKFNTPFILHKTLVSNGLPESILAEKLHDWEINLPKELSFAYLPNGKRVRLRISGYDSNLQKLEQLVLEKERELIELLGGFYEPYSDEPLERQLYELLKKKNLTISVAESCTGGAVSAKIVTQAGISDYFIGGMVSYSNKIKINQLKVNQQTIEKYGAVSEQTVCEMAKKISELYHTDIGVATSGIAPSINIGEDQEGKIFMAIYYKGNTKVYDYKFINLSRMGFIETAVNQALKNVIQLLSKSE